MRFMEIYISIFNAFIAVYVAIYSIYLLVSSCFGNLQSERYKRLKRTHNTLEHEYYYPISIIVPAYNESTSVVQTVNNLLKLEFKRYEIIVVDDGSTDDTKQCMLNAFPLKAKTNRPIRYQVSCQPIKEVYSCRMGEVILTLISKKNGGCKADAINAAINVCTYPYFVNMDGDEILQRDSLREACRAMLENDNLIAIGGNIKISNDTVFRDAWPVSGGFGKNPIVNMQIMEYSRSFQGTRVFQDMLNMNLIISGGFGIFKKDEVIKVGGYDVTSKGEDMEITVKLQQHCRSKKIPFSIAFVPSSVCWTQGPATLKDLKSQRLRWHCGLIQTMLKYKYMIFNPKYGIVGIFMLPYLMFYELLSPVIMVLGIINIIFSMIVRPYNLLYMVGLYLVYVLFGVLLTIIA